tara:strand:- start:149 stop:874 length:726 start_codon:yes stop_codon:yes gene_type:complete
MIKYNYLIFCLISFVLPIDFDAIDSYERNQQYDMEFKSIKLFYDESDINFMWRMARAYFNQAEQEIDIDKKYDLFYNGYDYSKKALQLDSASAKANHYYAVLHGQIGLIEGTNQKIMNSYDVLKYGKIAIGLDSTYDNTYHLLGRLNFELANLSWLERNIASIIYETPPEGTFGEAENYFKSAIAFNKNDIRHWLWLGKTYIAMGERSKAKESLIQASILIPRSQKDSINIKEAIHILDGY